MEMSIRFSGPTQIDALFDGFAVRTDQPIKDGGGGTAPSPYLLFLASLGTCAGFYVSSFLHKRKLSTEGVEMTLDVETDPKTHLARRVTIRITLPDTIPSRYHDALVRAASLCAVKKSIEQPPEFAIQLTAAR